MTAPYRIALVCLGNICRSPMAHVVLEEKLAAAGLDQQVAVASSGTGGWHAGEPMDPRAAAVLSDAGYDPTRHRARTFSIDWYAEHDLLLAMDDSNFADMTDQAPSVAAAAQVRMFREFDPIATDDDREVMDPWFGGDAGFEHVLSLIERTTERLIEQLPDLINS